MASNSSYVTCLIERVDRQTDVSISKKKKSKLMRELYHLKIFLLCVESWSSVDEEVSESLADLMATIEGEFAHLKGAIYGGEEKLIEQVKPKMEEGYGYLSEYCFQRARLAVTDMEFWEDVLNVVYNGLTTLVSDMKMAAPLKGQVEAFTVNFRSLSLLMTCLKVYLSNVKTYMPFWVYLGGAATCAAQVSYMCWKDGMNANKAKDLIILLSDLQHKIMPCTSETIQVYLGLLKALGSCDSNYINSCVNNIMDYCFSFKDQSGGSLYVGLGFFLRFLVTTPDEFSEDVKLISLDMKTVIAKAASFDTMLTRRKSERELELFQLVGKIEILNAEAVLMGLIIRSTKDKAPSASPLESLLQGVKMLHTFINHPPKGIIKQEKLILAHIEEVAIRSASLYETFSEVVIREVLKLLVSIKLLKAQIFWMELINKSTRLKHKVETLIDGLEGLRKIVSGKPDGDSDNGKLILVCVDEVACQAMSVYHSINANRGADNLIKETENQLPDLLDKICRVKAEAENVNVWISNSLRSNFPKTNGLGFFDFFLENLRKMLNHNPDSGSLVNNHLMEAVLTDLESLRSFLQETSEHCEVHHELRDVHSRIFNMAYVADYAIDSIVCRNGVVCYHTLCLSDITEEIKLVKSMVVEITEKKTYVKKKHGSSVTASVTQTSRHRISTSSGLLIMGVIVPLKDQKKVIIDQLTRGSQRRDIISIVGIGGIGKTTLAMEVFNDLSVKKDFHVYAWCSVSVAYQKRDLLLEILSHVQKYSGEDISGPHDQYDEFEFDKYTDDDIAHKLRQQLMKRKYLIVMDDVWDIQAWNDMQMSFPDDANGSRILFTCRDSVVALNAGGTNEPHLLRKLSEEESWKLLKAKVFRGQDCPEELLDIGKRIAIGCEGLPLAVVVMAGLLQGTNKTTRWKEFANDINTHVSETRKSYDMDFLEDMYKRLPDNLKPCFLYLGAFWGNKEIPVNKLLRLWIAEGFVSKVDSNDLMEDVAEAYLEELVHRKMIVATNKRSLGGGFKSCRVHDRLQTPCMSKAEQENFLQFIAGYDSLFRSFSECVDYGVDPDYFGPSVTYEHHRISIRSKRNHLGMVKPSGPQARSLLFSATTDTYPTYPYDVSFIVQNFRLLRVLDLETITIGISFLSEIEMLKCLKYLAVSGDIDSLPSAVAELWNLETLCVKSLKGQIVIPVEIWSMESLKHLHVKDTAIFRLPEDKSCYKLCHLITLSSPDLSCREAAHKMMKRLPNLRKLKCIFSKPHHHTVECKRSPVLDDLTNLESLKISYYGDIPLSCEFNFGSSLRKLSISFCHLPNKYASVIAKLPNLTVLKLQAVSFDDDKWSMNDNEFISLKYLKLDNVAISEWDACSDHLPCLQRLVLHNCKKFEEVPLSFHEIADLQTIELQRCSPSVEDSVKEIQVGQQELGNNKFKLFINLLEWDYIPS